MTIPIESDRLILRCIDMQDLEFLAELLADPLVMAYWPAPLTREQSIEWILRQQERYARHGCGYWLAIDKATRRPIGQAGVMILNIEGAEEAALGYIVHRPFWRRGFAMEATAACIRYAFDRLEKDRVIALIRPENTPSRQLALKLGMQPGKTILHAKLDHIVYSLHHARGG